MRTSEKTIPMAIFTLAMVGLAGMTSPGSATAQEIPTLPAGTYYGGVGWDGWYDVPVVEGPDGTVYVAGSTKSSNLPMPAGGFDTTYGGYYDVFVAHFDADMTQLLHATYLGGPYNDAAWPGVDMILADDGSIYVATSTGPSGYPTTPGAYAETGSGNYDVAITRLSADLSRIVASTLLGGSSTDDFPKLALHPGGDVLVVCSTKSLDFPVTPGAWQATARGGREIALARLSGDLSTLVAATYLGSTAVDDWPEALVVHGNDDVFLTGWTESTTFPTTAGAFMETASGGVFQAFVSCLSSDLTTLTASTHIGGNDWEFGYSLAVDDEGRVYAGGHTASTDFPGTAGGYQPVYGGVGNADMDDDMWVARFSHDLTTLEAATFIGGGGWENATALRLVPGGIMVGGTTSSLDWPTTAGAFRTGIAKVSYTESMGIARLDRDLTTLIASTYLGGRSFDNLGGLALTRGGDLLVAGSTSSNDLPFGAQAYDVTYNGGLDQFSGDAFLARLDLGLTGNPLAPAPDLPRTAGLRVHGACPNPFNPRTEVSFSVTETGRLRVAVFDLAGCRIATLADRVFAAGAHRIPWDGRDAQGRAAPSGTYLVNVADGRANVSVKAVLEK